MKRIRNIAVLLLAAIMLLCACDPRLLTKEGTLSIEGILYPDASYSEVFIDNELKDNFNGTKLEYNLAAGTHNLEIKAYTSKEKDKLIATYSKTFTINSAETETLKLRYSDWTDTYKKAFLAVDFPAYEGADEYEFEFHDESQRYSIIYRGLKYGSTKIRLGEYKFTATALKDGVKIAIADNLPNLSATEENYKYSYTFDATAWKKYDPSTVTAKFKFGVIPYEGADSYAIFVDGKQLELDAENSGIVNFQKAKPHNIEFYAFKNGKLIAQQISPNSVYDDHTIGIQARLFPIYDGTLEFTYAPCPTAGSYLFKLDGKDWSYKKNSSLNPGSHHLEAFALDSAKKPVAAKYIEFNVVSLKDTVVKLDSWTNTQDDVSNLIMSLYGATEGHCQMLGYPLNIMTQDQANAFSDGLNAILKNPQSPIQGITIVEPVKSTVEIPVDSTDKTPVFTATMTYKEKETNTETITFELVQDAKGTRLNMITNPGPSIIPDTQIMYFNMYPEDYGFRYAKVLADNVTCYSEVTYYKKHHEHWVAFHLDTKEELERLMKLNGFEGELTKEDWDKPNRYKRDFTNAEEGKLGINIIEAPQGTSGYSVSVWEMIYGK